MERRKSLLKIRIYKGHSSHSLLLPTEQINLTAVLSPEGKAGI